MTIETLIKSDNDIDTKIKSDNQKGLVQCFEMYYTIKQDAV